MYGVGVGLRYGNFPAAALFPIGPINQRADDPRGNVFVFGGQSNIDAEGVTGSPTGYGVLDTSIIIWNQYTALWETYNPGTNSNLGVIPGGYTQGDAAKWGPEASFALAWRAANPTKTFYMLKSGFPGMGLATAAQGGTNIFNFNPTQAGGGFDSLQNNSVEAMGVLAGTSATFSPQIHGSGFTLSNGNLTATSVTGVKLGRATVPVTTGSKRFCSFTIDSLTTWVMIGLLGSTSLNLNSLKTGFVSNSYVGGGANLGIAYWKDGTVRRSGSTIATIASYTVADVIDMEVDGTALTVRFRKNGGSWSTGYDYSTVTGVIFPTVSVEAAAVTANFGATAYTHARPGDASDFQQFANVNPVIRRLSWMQGEFDASAAGTAAVYAANLSDFASAYRSRCVAPTAKIVVGRISNSTQWANRAAVRTAQAAFPALDGNAAWFDTDDLTLAVDDRHYVSASVETMGQRFLAN